MIDLDLDVTNLDPSAQLRLSAFLDEVGALLGHKSRRESFALYALGLLGDGARKSAEPMAARLCGEPERVQAMHFQLCNFLRRSEWEDAPVRLFAARYALGLMQEQSPIGAWLIDDTGFLKQGDKSPGVQRQYTGSAGKVANCQVAVSLSLSSGLQQLPVDFRLYLPESWCDDRERCRAAHIPDEVGFAPKWKLALDMVRAAIEADLPRGVLLADADYGDNAQFRDALLGLGLDYSVAVRRHTVVERIRRHGRPLGRKQSVEEIAMGLAARSFRKITWREGTSGSLSSRGAAVRVLVDHDGREPSEQWLLIEWPEDQDKPTKYALNTLAPDLSRKQLFRIHKERWRTERIYQDLKGQLGLDHFEGRSFTGWHHHVTAVLCCYAFCLAEQARSFPPSASGAYPSGALSIAA